MIQVQLPAQYIGYRIDKALSEYFGLSRNFFHNLFERGLILGQGNNVLKKSLKIESEGLVIELPPLERYSDNQILEECPRIDLEIKHQTSDYMIIYKPKGVLSHPKTLFDLKEPSVVGFLYHQFGQLPTVSNFVRAGIVHRLDKDTDGLMIVALSERGLKYFRELFDKKAKDAEKAKNAENGEGELHKYYRAVCEVKNSKLKIQNGLMLDSMIYPKVPVQGYPKRGFTIIMSYELGIMNEKEVCIIELELLTGRTHQIRYQLAEIGLPIVGDWLYGNAKKLTDADNSKLQLTAFKLDFVDPDEKRVLIEIG